MIDMNAPLPGFLVSRQQVDLFAEEDLRDVIYGMPVNRWFGVYVGMKDFMSTITTAIWNQDCMKYSNIDCMVRHMEMRIKQLGSWDKFLLHGGDALTHDLEPF